MPQEQPEVMYWQKPQKIKPVENPENWEIHDWMSALLGYDGEGMADEIETNAI